ncbi:MAG: inositol monophosphatase family protein [Thermodesulfobacteriota bacterium]
MFLETEKRVGLAAAYKAAEVLRMKLGRLKQINKKGANDLVTEADAESERAIIDTIRTAFPHHGILAEESGADIGSTDCCWIIDPLDGTTNFAHELGLFSISIAYSVHNELIFGIVLSPMTDELFIATRGGGAFLNGRPIRVSGVQAVSESLLVTGFPYNVESVFDQMMQRFAGCIKAAQGVRRLGSAALDLCYVACGRFDAYWEQNLKPWDTAAGVVIAGEAGSVITDFSNRAFTPDKMEVLASNGIIHQEMLSLLELKDSTCEKS